MIIIPPPLFRSHRKSKAKPPAAVVVPLTLVSANYDDTVLEVYLVFDRPIDASGLDGSTVQVVDGNINGQTYLGTAGFVMMNDHTVRIELNSVGSASGPDVELSVGSGNGIVAVDGGAGWPGVGRLVLPFGE